jgi:protein-S-isoprenylcysteine O-methyltransferase Ste14
MKIITLIILLTFIIFRNSFTLLKGKRKRVSVTTFIYLGRKMIEIFVYLLIPILLLMELLKTNIYPPVYFLGLGLSILGLGFMVWTRLYRNKDWGFMGDEAGNSLFTHGAYRFTRHPYYIGAILVGIGLYLQLNYFLVILMLPVVFFILYVIKKEDAYLQEQFGQEYIAYKNKVGIIPWFY